MCVFPPLWKKEGDRKKEKKKRRGDYKHRNTKKQDSEKKGSRPVHLIGLSSPPQTHSDSDLLGHALVSCILCLRMCAGCQRAGCRRTSRLPRWMEPQGLLDADPAARTCLLYPRDAEALRRPPVHTAHTAADLVISPSLASARRLKTRRVLPLLWLPAQPAAPTHCFFSLSHNSAATQH